MGEKVWGKNILTCTVITKWDLVGGCCREVGAEVGVGGWSRWCRLPGTSSRRMPPPTAFTGSPAHGHGHAQPRRHCRHRRRRRRCPQLSAPRLHLLPPASRRAASSCGLHMDAAAAVMRAAVALSVGCRLWDAARGALQFQCSLGAVACRAGGSQLHGRVHRSCIGTHGCMAFAFVCSKLGSRLISAILEYVILQGSSSSRTK